MWSTLVDFCSCRNRRPFPHLKEFRRDVGLSIKSLETLKFDKIRVKKQNRRSQATAFEAGRFEFQKRSSFLKRERGRQAIVYKERLLIVGLVSF